MRREAVLLQQASGDHLRLLDITETHHRGYSERHGFDYWVIRGRLGRERHPYWDKIALIRMALELGQHEFVVWLDADAFIWQVEQDLRSALAQDEWIGLVKHDVPGFVDAHLNCGVIYIRNTEQARRFFDDVWSQWPVNHAWEDQKAVEQALRKADYREGVAVLEDRWNSTPNVNFAKDAVVYAWHGSDVLHATRAMGASLQNWRDARAAASGSRPHQN